MIPSSEHPCSGYRNLVPLGTLEAEPRIRCKRTNERTDGGELKGKISASNNRNKDAKHLCNAIGTHIMPVDRNKRQ